MKVKIPELSVVDEILFSDTAKFTPTCLQEEEWRKEAQEFDATDIKKYIENEGIRLGLFSEAVMEEIEQDRGCPLQNSEYKYFHPCFDATQSVLDHEFNKVIKKIEHA